MDPSKEYLAGGVLRKFPPQWPSVLKVVARLNFLLPSTLPDDVVACTSLHAEQSEPIHHVWILCVFLAQTIKWPPAVMRFYEELGLPTIAGYAPPRGGGKWQEHTGKSLRQAYRQVILWADGRDFGTMLGRMNGGGLQDAQTGLAVNAVALGFLGDSASGQSVRLGKGAVEYTLVEEGHANQAATEQWMDHLLLSAQEARFAWPAESREVEAFAESVDTWAAAARRYKPPADPSLGLNGGRSKKHAYKRLSLVRMVLVWVERFLSDAFNVVPFSVLQGFLPELQHTGVFQKKT
jgi:hypothetical protein